MLLPYCRDNIWCPNFASSAIWFASSLLALHRLHPLLYIRDDSAIDWSPCQRHCRRPSEHPKRETSSRLVECAAASLDVSILSSDSVWNPRSAYSSEALCSSFWLATFIYGPPPNEGIAPSVSFSINDRKLTSIELTTLYANPAYRRPNTPRLILQV